MTKADRVAHDIMLGLLIGLLLWMAVAGFALLVKVTSAS